MSQEEGLLLLPGAQLLIFNWENLAGGCLHPGELVMLVTWELTCPPALEDAQEPRAGD